ncbi:thioredoxin domain-containing protein [Brevundimonas lutea]|uniref:DsbA family protein n=1 Tax=Brevundimonas lutea TaxID=2293980 RepID=UPI0013CEBE50|nr:thioredoxin domain-containing protein [Brevundimonas lutea]
MTESPPPAAAGKPRSDRLLSMAALGVAAVALGVAGWSQMGFDSRVRAYLMANPTVLEEVMQARQQAEYANLFQRITEGVAANPQLLAADPRDPAVGPEGASVVVHQFFDYRCPYCKVLAEPYLALIERHPNVRFVFKEWPILDGPQDGISHYAARAALAADAQGRYLPVHQALMAADSLDQATVDQALAQAGVDMAAARAFMEAETTRRHVQELQAAAATVGLQGTPTFFVDGRVSETNDPAALEQAIVAAKG